jgi:hypothetical protein
MPFILELKCVLIVVNAHCVLIENLSCQCEGKKIMSHMRAFLNVLNKPTESDNKNFNFQAGAAVGAVDTVVVEAMAVEDGAQEEAEEVIMTFFYFQLIWQYANEVWFLILAVIFCSDHLSAI